MTNLMNEKDIKDREISLTFKNRGNEIKINIKKFLNIETHITTGYRTKEIHPNSSSYFPSFYEGGDIWKTYSVMYEITPYVLNFKDKYSSFTYYSSIHVPKLNNGKFIIGDHIKGYWMQQLDGNGNGFVLRFQLISDARKIFNKVVGNKPIFYRHDGKYKTKINKELPHQLQVKWVSNKGPVPESKFGGMIDWLVKNYKDDDWYIFGNGKSTTAKFCFKDTSTLVAFKLSCF